MERADRPPVATFYAPGEWAARVELGEAAAHHASVKRLVATDAVRLTSGKGRRASAVIVDQSRRSLVVEIDSSSVEQLPSMPEVALWAPVGDRERMLTLAEKAVELGASSWQPIVYRRSRSVAPRGEGAAFREKVRLRMLAALEQSGSAWMPTLHAEASLELLLSGTTGGTRLLLDERGDPLAPFVSDAPVIIALGPEGGLEADERDAFVEAGWRVASLGPNVLRFETAGIAALAIVRSLLR